MTVARWQNSIEQIMLTVVGQQERILGLTSLRPGAGVSLVCHHIARTAAAGEFKTLLLDISEPQTDDTPVRTWRPGHERISNLITPTVGRYDYLKVRTDEATRPLFCNPAHLRSVYRTELDQYALVVVDLPPLLEPTELGPNPVAAAGSCDQVLLLCAVGRDTRSELADAISLVGGAGGRLAGLVSNEYLYEQPLEQIGRLAGFLRAVPRVARLPLVACRWIGMRVAGVMASASVRLVADAKELLWATYWVARLPVVALRWIATCVSAASSWTWAKLVATVKGLLRAALWLARLPVEAMRWIATRIGVMASWLSSRAAVAGKALLGIVHWLARLPMVALRWMATCIAAATSWTAKKLVLAATLSLRAARWVGYLPVAAFLWIANCVSRTASWTWAKLVYTAQALLSAARWLARLPLEALRWIATGIGMAAMWLSSRVAVAAKALLRAIHWLARLPMVALRWMVACIAAATSWTARKLVLAGTLSLRAARWVGYLPVAACLWIANCVNRTASWTGAKLVHGAQALLSGVRWVARLPLEVVRWIAAATSWTARNLVLAATLSLRAARWVGYLPVAACLWIANCVSRAASWTGAKLVYTAQALLSAARWLARLPVEAVHWMATCIAAAMSWTATKLVLAGTLSVRAVRWIGYLPVAACLWIVNCVNRTAFWLGAKLLYTAQALLSAVRWLTRLPVAAYRLLEAGLFAAAAKISQGLLRFGRGAFRTASHLLGLPSRLIALLSRAARRPQEPLAPGAGHRSELPKARALTVLVGGTALIATAVLDPLGWAANKGNRQLDASLIDATPPMLKTAALDIGSYRGEHSTFGVPAASGLPASRTDAPPAIQAHTVPIDTPPAVQPDRSGQQEPAAAPTEPALPTASGDGATAVAISLPEPDTRLRRTSDSPPASSPDAAAPEAPNAAPGGAETASTDPSRQSNDHRPEQTMEPRATVVVAEATPATGTPRLIEARTDRTHAPTGPQSVVDAPEAIPAAEGPAIDASPASPSAQPDPASAPAHEAVAAPSTIAATGSDARTAAVATPLDSSSLAPPAAQVGQQVYPAPPQAMTQPAANVTAVAPPEASPAISPPGLTDTSAPTDRSYPAPAPIPTLSAKERELAEKMVARGERELANGNVAQARLFFLNAAKAGLPRGALLLAATYDPRELAGPSILGVQPNIALARQWYERARELGATEAAERLGGLAAR